jgi:hypothetical protein
MNKTMCRLILLLLPTIILLSCNSKKTEEKETIVVIEGNYSEADKPAGSDEEQPSFITSDIKWKFEKNGGVSYQFTKSYPDPTSLASESDPAPRVYYTRNFIGKWKVKKSKLTLTFEKLIEPDAYPNDNAEFYPEYEKDLCDELNKIFKSMKIIANDDKQIIFKDKKGEKHTLTKSKN